MKVLQINAVNGIKSTGRTTLEMADYLNNIGHDAYIAYSDGLPYENGYKVGSNLEKKLHGLYSRILGKQAYFSKNGTKNLLEFIKKLKPDVIHLHNLHSNFINLELLLEFLAEEDIPTVLTLHDCWFYTGKCTHYTVDGCDRWKIGCGNCPRLKKDNPSWFFDQTKKMYNDKKGWFQRIPRLAVVGVSDWITNEARLSLLSSAKVITRIYNWIDLEVFKPTTIDKYKQILGVQDKFIILGVASRWSKSKGLDKFIEISKEIKDDTVVVLIGSISDKIKLPNNIIHVNETHDVNELVAYYSMADVLLNPSLEESFGKVTAEALACGTPAVVFNSTANPELIGEGCGYVSLSNKTTELLQKIDKIKDMGKMSFSKNCIEFANQNFKMDNRIEDYIDVYKKLCNLKGD